MGEVFSSPILIKIFDMTLKEIYELGQDIKDSDFPVEWKPLFMEFMYGQAYTVSIDNETGKQENLYYSQDFRRWYQINRKCIERENKIEQVINI